MAHIEHPWGRLLIAGGTDFAILGRKDKSGKSLANPDRPDLASAHVIRETANIKFKRVFTSHSGCHAVAITLDEQAYLLGRNEHHQLTHPLPATCTTVHLTPAGLPSDTPAAGVPFALRSLPDSNVPKELKKQRIVSAAVGRGHTVLVTKKGEVWTAGWNVVGQCGHPESTEHISSFKRVKGALADEKVVAASCGTMHTLFLTDKGEVYAVGTGEKGVLGGGRTGEHIAGSRVLFDVESSPQLVGGALEGRKIVEITSGQQHNIAMDDEGFCFAWGFGGLGRLGLGAQVDSLLPVEIPQFSGANPLTRCKHVSAGSTNTMFIDRQDMVLICGKFKTSGDGSAGQPWMTPKSVYELQGYKMALVSAGGVTLFAHAQDPKEGMFTCAWGQNANNRELALGEGAAKSATKPTRIDSFDGIELLDLAAGQNSTFFLARPPPTQAAKDEAKTIVESVPPAAPAAPVAPSADANANASSSASATPGGAMKPTVDLSGFGFSFMPSPAGSPVPPTSAAATPPSAAATAQSEAEAKKRAAAGISRTNQAAWEEVPRWPEVEGPESCGRCGGGEAEEGKGELLICEKCEATYHAGCCSPPIQGVPDGEWFCHECDVNPYAFEDEEDEGQEGKKRKAEEDGEDEEAVNAAKKRK
ncbi:hypothetical protein JCM11251_006676 [Rhodosporidiobolus azoricus]